MLGVYSVPCAAMWIEIWQGVRVRQTPLREASTQCLAYQKRTLPLQSSQADANLSWNMQPEPHAGLHLQWRSCWTIGKETCGSRTFVRFRAGIFCLYRPGPLLPRPVTLRSHAVYNHQKKGVLPAVSPGTPPTGGLAKSRIAAGRS